MLNLKLKFAKWLRKVVFKIEQEGLRNVDRAMGKTFPLRTELETVLAGPKGSNWHQAIEVYNDGLNVCIWGYQGTNIKKELASKEISNTDTGWYKEPDYLVADYLVSLQQRLFELFDSGNMDACKYREYLENLEQARQEILTRSLQENIQ